jgi:hypothetical protein
VISVADSATPLFLVDGCKNWARTNTIIIMSRILITMSFNL